MRLSELLPILTREQKIGLEHMFELGQPHFVILKKDSERWFIGVHLYQLDHLIPTDTKGTWSCGRMQ